MTNILEVLKNRRFIQVTIDGEVVAKGTIKEDNSVWIYSAKTNTQIGKLGMGKIGHFKADQVEEIGKAVAQKIRDELKPVYSMNI